MLVELKNGETLNGHLVQCDTWMNLTLKEVVQTSPVGRAWIAEPWRGVMKTRKLTCCGRTETSSCDYRKPMSRATM